MPLPVQPCWDILDASARVEVSRVCGNTGAVAQCPGGAPLTLCLHNGICCCTGQLSRAECSAASHLIPSGIWKHRDTTNGRGLSCQPVAL